MSINIQLSDLLPLIYDTLVKQCTHKELLPLERESILQAIINSVRWSVVRRGRADEEGESSLSQSVLELNTADRFSNAWMSRTEIIERIRHSSGLDESLSHLALTLMEARLDLALTANEVSIEGIGEIVIYEESKYKEHQSNIESTYNMILRETLLSHKNKRRSLLEFLRRKPALYLTEFIEMLEMIAAFRQPLPYQIKVSSHLMVSHQALSQSRVIELPQDEEHRFKWDEQAAFSSKKVLKLLRR
jgi:hypothetical protein